VLEAIVRAALGAGARLANPGEFTFRAYLHGRIDLVQAEAVGELIDAVTPLQARVAFDQLEGTLTARLREMDRALLDLIAPLEASLDFPDEGYHFITPDAAARALDASRASLEALLADASRGKLIARGSRRDCSDGRMRGSPACSTGSPARREAIVTDVPGTTRDLLTERVDVGGVPFTIVDTAGPRASAGDAIEEEGSPRAAGREAADLVLVVLDRPRAATTTARCWRRRAAARLSSRARATCGGVDAAAARAEVSSLTDVGSRCSALRWRDGRRPACSRPRPDREHAHAPLLEKAATRWRARRAAARGGRSEECVLADLHEARGRFDEITGARPQDEVLRVIFERFCIGK
jgi:tRNA modification GTPase